MKTRLQAVVVFLTILSMVSGPLQIEAPRVQAQDRSPMPTLASAVDERARVAAALQSSPVMFIENVGQFDAGARFQVRGSNSTVYLAEDAVWFTLRERRQTETGSVDPTDRLGFGNRVGLAATNGPDHFEDMTTPPVKAVNLKLSFVGANPNPVIEPFDRLDTHVSYFTGSDPAKWRSDVPVWGGVRYKDLYPGIDLEVTGDRGRMVQQMVSRLGADLSAVRLRIEGAESVLLLKDGDRLALTTASGDFLLPLFSLLANDSIDSEAGRSKGRVANLAPSLLRDDTSGAGAWEIAAPFAMRAEGNSNRLPSVGLSGVSDLIYATFLGGSSGDSGEGIAVDANGAAYVTGDTVSSNFPVTTGAYDRLYNGHRDVFVVKMNATGANLAYATFLGGSDNDYGYAIAVDTSGAAYVTGETGSSNFPVTTGAYDASFNGGNIFPSDAFVVKLNASGTHLAYATFLGGSDNDYGYAIAVDTSGAAYVTGETGSSHDFPVTSGAYQTSCGFSSAFVVKLNTSGSDLAYATCLGGADKGIGIAVDASGAGYVTGETGSSNFPVTAGAYDTSFNGPLGGNDAFVAKVNATGASLAYATFLGGSSFDYGIGVAVDTSGAAYVTGKTISSDFPVTTGAYDTSSNGGYDAFVVKLDATGAKLDYATFLGGSGFDYGYGIALDTSGAAYITGATKSRDFPATTGAYDTSHNGGSYGLDAFVAKLNATGTDLTYATFLGGSDDDYGGIGIAVDTSGSAYVTGATDSYDFPVTSGAYDTSFSGYYADAFVVKLTPGGGPGAAPRLGVAPSQVPADGVSTATVTLFGAPVGHRVRLLSTRGNIDVFSSASGIVHASGQFTATIRSSSAGTAVLTAQDTSTGETFATSAQVTFVGAGGTLPPAVGAVSVTGVRPEHPLNARYLQGIRVPNQIRVAVDWKDTTPGRVDFVLNGRSYSEAAGADASHTFDMGVDLQPGTNSLQIVAYAAGGQSSTAMDFSPYLTAAPVWLSGLLALGAIGPISMGGSVSAGPEYESYIKFPAGLLDLGIPDFGPKGTKSELNFLVSGDLRLPVQCSDPLEISVMAGAEAKIEFTSIELGGELKGRGAIRAQSVQCEIPTAQGSVRIDLKVWGQKNWPVLTIVGDFIFPGAGTAVEQALRSVGIDPQILGGGMYLQASLHGSFEANVNTVSRYPYLEWQGTRIGVGPGIEGGYHWDLSVVEVKVFLGADGTIEFYQPGALTDLSNLRPDRVTVGGEGGYKIRVLFFEKDGKYRVEWTYPPRVGIMSPAIIAGDDSGWHLIGHPANRNYAVFRAAAGAARQAFAPPDGTLRPSGVGARGTVTNVLVANIYTYTEPSLAVDPATGNALMLWVHDDIAKPVGQSHEIYFSRWDGSSWSAPSGATNDFLLDSAPRVAWASGQAVAVWQRLDESLPITATWDVTTAKKMEIATAAYNPSSGAWSPVSLLTNDGALDMVPQLARNGDGQLLAVWRQNADGLLSGDATHPDRVMAAFYDGAWGTPAAAVGGIPGLVDLAAGYGSNAATIAYTRYLTPTGSPTPTLQLFTSAWNGASWSTPVQRTNDSLGHRSPQVVYNAANQPLLIWLSGGELRLRNLNTGSASGLTLPAAVGDVDEFRVVQDAGGNIAAVFTAQASQRDLYVALYDADHGLWGKPTRLTNDRASEAYPTAGLDSAGRLLLGYSATAVDSITRTTTISGTGEVVTYTVPTEGQTDLVTLSHVFTRNLTLGNGDLAISDSHPAPGSTVVVSATVRNTGDLAVNGVVAGFYDGDPTADGSLIATRSLGALLAGGFTATVSITYTAPVTGGIHALFVAVDPANAIAESDETDNVAGLAAFGPDLEVASAAADYWGGSDVGLRTVVRNIGTSAAPTSTIGFYRGVVTGSAFTTDTVPALAAGETYTLTTPWNFGSLAAGAYPVVAVVNRSDFTETFVSNNLYSFTLDVRPDLMVSPYYLWTTPLTATTVAVTATVYNVGAITATDVTVGFYRRASLDAASLLFTRTVPSLPSAGSAQLSGEVAGPLGCGLYVSANPYRSFAETTFSNNLASVSAPGGRCANFWNSPASGISPLTVVFTDTSSGDNTSWLWRFGDGLTSTIQSPTHTYSFSGAYSVTLSVSGPDGQDQFTREGAVTVYAPAHAGFSALPVSGAVPLQVGFTDRSSGDITSWSWNFGDGITSTRQSPSHIYVAAGVYNVTLSVAGYGGSDTFTRSNYITVRLSPAHSVYLPLATRGYSGSW
ncbi:MAG: SBBP repeat-containing protein [Chloroflexi bacterium]|nr:SBBP repeat-containing protein [Chloroflexota bacterium]